MKRSQALPLVACVLLVVSIYFFSFHLLGTKASSPGLTANDEKPLVVVIPSYNNSQWYERNLQSLFEQEYSNYRVIYIEDCSADDTYELVKSYIKKMGQEDRVTLIHNAVNQGALKNLYDAIHTCKDHEIIIDYDGDDFLKHKQVLARINQAYKDQNIWMTYGQYQVYPEGHLGHCRAIPAWVTDHNSYRGYNWVTSHLRTFYAGLFKRIKREDFLYNGSFFDATSDLAFMFPMLEMAGKHIEFIPEVLYIYNQANPINDWKVKFARQQYFDKYIRNMSRYERLDTLFA